MHIGGKKIYKNSKPFLVAEISANHNGSIDRAKQTISAAKASGADAVKIQTYTADTITINCNKKDFQISDGPWAGQSLYDLYKLAETPFEWHEELFDYANKINIPIFSTPFDETAVELLESLRVPAYKIASFEVVDLPLIDLVARTGKPLILSTGMASLEEISEAVDCVLATGNDQLILLHCVSSYPTPIEAANIKAIETLSSRFQVPVGLSDHTMGSVAACTAVSLGACFVEKHFTLSRSEPGPDSSFSMEPAEFLALEKDINETWRSLGSGIIERAVVEKSSEVFRRSLYFVKNLPAGHVLTEGDFKSIRPGYGLAPKHSKSIAGRVLKRDVEFGTPVLFDVLL